MGCQSSDNNPSIHYVKEFGFQTINFKNCDQILERGNSIGSKKTQTDDIVIKLKVWRMDGENIYSDPGDDKNKKNDSRAMEVHFRMNDLFHIQKSDGGDKLPLLYYHTEYHPLPQSSLLLLLVFEKEKIAEMCSKSNNLLLIFEDKYFSESILEFPLTTL